MQDVQTTREAFSSQNRISSTSKHETSSLCSTVLFWITAAYYVKFNAWFTWSGFEVGSGSGITLNYGTAGSGLDHSWSTTPMADLLECSYHSNILIFFPVCCGYILQCCGSGSGIRDPGWVESQHPDPGWSYEQPGSYFLELRNHFFGFFEG